MTGTAGYHALVIGASGLIGWAVVNQLLQPYPSQSPYRKVTALVNRPLDLQDSFWPEHASGRPQLSLTSGVDLMSSEKELKGVLTTKVPDIDSVSHVYYFGKLYAVIACSSRV
jgi:hypothetical protein